MVYNHEKIEKKWRKIWRKEKVYQPDLKRAKRPFYNLMMFPYPSAEGLHVGNMYAFTGSDVYGRFKRMQGYDVFEPIGLDGFGIHSENYALKIGAHPMEQAKISEKRFYKQLKMIGNGFAWDEHLETYDPKYYRWTQWIFAQMFKNGLAFRKKQSVNWCPSCKTVLADEQVISGECERCSSKVVKKELEQWFFKITKYADRLLKNLEKIDWSEKVKVAQREWIGQSQGAEIEFRINPPGILRKQNSGLRIPIFTTRPDTLFGSTYLVLSPEHELIQNLESRIKNLEEVRRYIKKAKNKSEEEQIAEAGAKTGVELKGVKAINPASKKEIPIFIADYVLSSYGTGAIMAVPAHDERDFEFAKKFKLPIIQVIAQETGIKRPNEEKRDGAFAFVFDPVKQKYAVGKDMVDGRIRLFSGGIDGGEDMVQGIKREVREEGGLYDFAHVEKIGTTFPHYHNKLKNVDRVAEAQGFLIILKSDKIKSVKLEEHEKFELVWVTPEEMEKNWQDHNQEGNYTHWINFLQSAVARAIEMGFDKKSDSKKYKPLVYIGNGVLINSGKFSEIDSEKAKGMITKFVKGKKQIQYHLRDWLISRQRYWGAPIPMIYCQSCAKNKKGERKEMPGWYSVQENQLPVKLPYVENFRPKGKGVSPLASVKSFFEAKCPSCGARARRETDVSDTFLDSAWYYLCYPSVGEKKHAWNPELTKKWLPVNMYIGGAEHSVLHLLYSRFLTMVFNSLRLLNFDEPFTKFRAHGLLIKEGSKMAKSKGNIVNPDEYIKKFGADVFRMYLMFLAPFEQGGDFRDAGILGISRFLERVYKLIQNSECKNQNYRKDLPQGDKSKFKNEELERLLHKTVKKITEDIENLKYNTAISALMILLNELEKSQHCGITTLEQFLKLLAPFAPFMTEELWEELGRKTSIHLEPWPKYDIKLIHEDKFELVIQINGRIRDKISVETGISQKEAEKLALSQEKIKIWLKDKKVKKIIFVPNRLINFVLENG